MSLHVFVTLAAVIGAVHGLPQHRFQPYQVSFTAGKPADSVSLGVGSADPIAPVIPSVESAQTSSVVETAPYAESSVTDTSMSPDFQNLWQQAAQNLVSIPHLLQWVSSLRADTLMEDLMRQQKAAVTPIQTQYEEPLPEPAAIAQPQEKSSVYIKTQPEETVVVEPEPTTEVYDATTEGYFFEETTPVPEPVVSEQKPLETVHQQTTQEETLVKQEVINEEPVRAEPEIIEQEFIVPEPEVEATVSERQRERIQEEPVYIEQEPVEIIRELQPTPEFIPVQPEPSFQEAEPVPEVVYKEPEPVVEVYSEPEPVAEVAYTKPEPVAEPVYTEPEPVAEIVYIEPEPVAEVVYTEPKPVAKPVYTEPEPVAEVVYTEPEPVYYEPEPVYNEPEPVYNEPEPVYNEPAPVYNEPEPVYNEPEPVAQVVYTEPEPISEVVYTEPEPVVEKVYQPFSRQSYTKSRSRTRTSYTKARQSSRLSYTKPKPISRPLTQTEPQIRRRPSWNAQVIPTYEKFAPVETKKPVSKFRYNRFNRSKNTPKKGKALVSRPTIQAQPARVQTSPFSLDSFTFPAYSYSISHQPTSVYFPGRR